MRKREPAVQVSDLWRWRMERKSRKLNGASDAAAPFQALQAAGEAEAAHPTDTIGEQVQVQVQVQLQALPVPALVATL